MAESPLLKNARRKLAQQRQQQQDNIDATLASQKKAAVRNIARGIVLLIFVAALAFYFAQYR